MRSRAAGAALVIAALVAVAPALACSYDGEDNGLSVDTLNHYYPDSYDVVLSVVEARRQGRLKAFTTDTTPKLVALQRVTRVLREVDRLRTSTIDAMAPDVAVLLVESMFWARLPAGRPGQMHASGAAAGDVVIVTSEDAMALVAAHGLSFAQAEAAGWLRIYGAAEAVTAFRSAYGAVGS